MSKATREILEKNTAEKFRGDSVLSLKNAEIIIDNKLTLNGTPKEKLAQLDQRETELLKEIARLKQEIEVYKRKKTSLTATLSHMQPTR